MIKLQDKKYVTRPSRQVPVVTECDVLVCGGGPAGCAAALAAARNGAKVVLIESAGCLGGVMTSGLLSWLIDCDKTGIVRELINELKSGTDLIETSTPDNCYSRPEAMKLLLEQKCFDAGIAIKLHTIVVEAITDSENINCVITESISGPEAHCAAIYIDCTGDGDLGAFAGCGYDLGREPDGQTQPMSMLALLTGLDFSAVSGFTAHVGSESPYADLLAEMRRAKLNPSYSRPTLYHLGKNIFCLASNHQYCDEPLSADAISLATLEARREINDQINGLRSLGGVWRNIQLIATSGTIGIREGRRIHGLYKVTKDDLISGRRHADAVCDVCFGVDIHSVNGAESKGIVDVKIVAKPYQIPLRALQSRDRRNLMMAGRCISGDFFAHSSYRVCGNAITLGEAAGKYAAQQVTALYNLKKISTH